MGNLSTSRKFWAMNARAVYVGGTNNFIFSENSTVPGRSNVLSQNLVYVAGNGNRPYTVGDLNFSLFLTSRLTLVENASADSNRIDGNAAIIQYNFITAARASLNFDYLGVRTFASASTLIYRITDWISLTGGWQYSNRRVTTVTSNTGVRTTTTTDLEKNQERAESLGIRLQPLAGLTVNLSGELARDDQPLYPDSDRNYHALNGRAEYRLRKLRLTTGYRQVYNVNSPGPITTFSSHSRDYNAGATWSLRERISLDAGYTKLHLDTASGIDFFSGTGSRLAATPGTSVYISNIHAVNLGARIGVMRRAELYLGYSLTRDAGDGRAALVKPGDTGAQAVLDSVQTFPLSYQTPLARLSVKLRPKLSWNLGWQFYRYRQDFALISILQNYRAHTGYSSLQWSF